VNMAARIEQAAAPGEVLVGEATWALVGHAAHGEQVAPIAAKGKREPLRAWRLEGVDPEARSHRRRLDLPMIGRDTELDLLRWALERTGRASRPHLVTVIGQPGIGKSRLVAELPRLTALVAQVTAPDLTPGSSGQLVAPPAATTGGPYAYPEDGSIVRVGAANATASAQPGVSASAQSTVAALSISLFGLIGSIELKQDPGTNQLHGEGLYLARPGAWQAKTFGTDGFCAPSVTTSSNVRPVNRVASSPGLPIVALASIHRGEPP